MLDAGSGTGLAGKVLYEYGYTNLVAIDISEEMLYKARQKNIYTELYKQVLGETLDFPTNFFDAIICVGVFTYSHAPNSAFDELIRITKPGGYIIFTEKLRYKASPFMEKEENFFLVNPLFYKKR
ncbi:MAG: class I SAM-dependent methyltransferase [Okeania sp. SIO3B3]|nr:class I SAM-dependent methyltransferase [Okeania sp. SIO3B3]